MGRKNKAQEEMVGFGLIIALVAIILLVFLWFSFSNSKKETVQSYEAESFVQAALQYSSECQDSRGNFMDVEDLISACYKKIKCSDEKDTCQVLNSSLATILKDSWKVEKNSPIKGYEMNISVNGEGVFYAKEGNSTAESKGAIQALPTGKSAEIVFNAYY
ncbi:MAG: hypothetical protein AABW51_00275 [Nanoarchaeota archaeon]